MLCIAMLVALNRGHELRLHISGAISNGLHLKK
jgi:alkylhydroperoxidase/carboxymuconolactone decarboxylase family protein YurZ